MLCSAHLINEAVKDHADAPEESLMAAIKRLVVLLQQVHSDGQQSPQHVRQAEAELQKSGGEGRGRTA